MHLPRVRRYTVAALALAGAVVVPAPPSYGHSADPRVTTVVDEVSPPLPGEVVVQVQSNLAAQLVVDNPTAIELEVLSEEGRPFLRLSAAGVFADVDSRAFYATSNPVGSTSGAPATPATTPRWVRVSRGSSWGWYDHRLHPEQIAAPRDTGRQARLGEWEVPFRYGERDVTVRGHLQFRPLLGQYVATADPAPAGLDVQALPGRLPGLLLVNADRRPLTVLGRDGEPFLRWSAAGLEVNEASRTHVEDRQARGEATAGPPSDTPRWRLVDPAGTTHTWLDARLAAPDQPPADPGSPSARPWEVPVVLGSGERAALTGEVTWWPSAETAAAGDGDRGTLPLALGAVAVVALAGTVLAVRRRR